jgi:VWFA-related protein
MKIAGVERQMCKALGAAVAWSLLVGLAVISAQTGGAGNVATFRSGVDLVTMNAVVRDRRGRIVPDLKQADFELIDGGVPRSITGFRAEQAPVSLALLVDASGSMQVASKIEDARRAARLLAAWLHDGSDEVGLFSFDSGLRQIEPFAPYRGDASLERSLGGIAPFGMTSLHDAIAATARDLAARPNAHRAVIVFTDGVDNDSHLTAPEVSGIASAIDVPVYIIAVVSPLDHQGAATAVMSARPVPVGDLADLAHWTGGEFYVSSAPADTSLATRQIVEELRHQYLIAFERGSLPGWHPLELRTRRRQLVVRARSGYIVDQPRAAISPGIR